MYPPVQAALGKLVEDGGKDRNDGSLPVYLGPEMKAQGYGRFSSVIMWSESRPSQGGGSWTMVVMENIYNRPELHKEGLELNWQFVKSSRLLETHAASYLPLT